MSEKKSVVVLGPLHRWQMFRSGVKNPVINNRYAVSTEETTYVYIARKEGFRSMGFEEAVLLPGFWGLPGSDEIMSELKLHMSAG